MTLTFFSSDSTMFIPVWLFFSPVCSADHDYTHKVATVLAKTHNILFTTTKKKKNFNLFSE